jgi:uncharacterized coiled-coil protein SlyX
LHIKEGDTPTVRLHQSTSYGWPEQIWDVGGNETSFFIRDATHAARLPFRIEPETPSSTMCLKSDGYVGLGTWSPAYPLEVETTGEASTLVMERTDGASAKIAAKFNNVQIGSITNHDLRFIRNDTQVGHFNSSGDLTITGDYYPTSDVNAKTDFVAVDTQEVLAAVAELPINTWSYKTDEFGSRHMGPTAQDFYAAFEVGKDDKHISTLDSAGVALAAIQGLNEIVVEKEAQIETLEEQNAEMQARLTALEKGAGEEQPNSKAPTASLLPWVLVGVLAGALMGVVTTAVSSSFALRKRLHSVP